MAAAATMRTYEWQEVATEPEQRPTLPRSGHCAAALPADHADDVIVFGGYTEDAGKQRKASNETWVLSLATGGWWRVAAEGPQPQERLAAQLVVVGNSAWLIGGWDPSGPEGNQFLSDVWVLDLGSWAWRQVELQGGQLPPISRFQAVAVGERIFIHTHRNDRDILVLDTRSASLAIVALQTPQGAPSSRGLHSVTAVGDRLYLFGGASQRGLMMGDLWELDTSTMTWTPLAPQGPQPHVRCSHVAAAVGPLIFYCGGAYYKEDASGLQGLSDFFVLDTQRCEWQWPTVGGAAPSARNAATMVAVQDGDGGDGARLVLYGGWRAFMETYNDTFVMRVRP